MSAPASFLLAKWPHSALLLCQSVSQPLLSHYFPSVSMMTTPYVKELPAIGHLACPTCAHLLRSAACHMHGIPCFRRQVSGWPTSHSHPSFPLHLFITQPISPCNQQLAYVNVSSPCRPPVLTELLSPNQQLAHISNSSLVSLQLTLHRPHGPRHQCWPVWLREQFGACHAWAGAAYLPHEVWGDLYGQ